MLRKVFKKPKKDPTHQPSASSQDGSHTTPTFGAPAPGGQRLPTANVSPSSSTSLPSQTRRDFTSNATAGPTTSPQTPIARKPPLYDVLRTRADDRAQSGDYDGAVLLYGEALGSAPTSSALYLSRSLAYMMITPPRLDLALIDADAAVQYDPTNWQAWLQQGETLLKMGDGEGAEESLLNAVQFAQGVNKLTAQKSLAEVRVRRTGQPPAAEQPASAIQSKSPVKSSTSELAIRAPPATSIPQPPNIQSALQNPSLIGLVEIPPLLDGSSGFGLAGQTPPVAPPDDTSSGNVPASTPQIDQATEKINSSALSSSTDSRNSSTKPPRSLGKLRNRTNRALVSQSTLKVRSVKLIQDISGAKPRVEAVDRLLKGGADPNTCTNEGESALKLATSKDEYSIVQLLLKYGADPTKLDANGSSPLEEAFSRGNSQIALALLEKDARLDSGCGNFGTCIQAAARGGNLELCKLVTDRGWYSNLSGSGFYGSALQAGVVSHNREVVEFILGHGADVNVKGGYYGTCIRAAAEDEDLEMCRLLISKGANVNLATNAGETALLSAVTKENFEVCELLLDAGATITEGIMKVAWSTENEKKWDMLHLLGRRGGTVDDIQIPYFGTLLQSFASQSDVGKCKILLEDCNVNINVHGGHYGTALQAAVTSKSREARDLVRLLLAHGADPNIIGGEFGTALHAAVASGRDDLCSLLIDAGADVNAVSNGDTALHLAARNKHSKLVKLLLDKGANPAAVGADGRTALLLAAASGQESWVKLLLNKYISINKNTSNGNIALSLAAANAVVDADGRTALHLAATNGHHGVVQLLLKNAANYAAVDKDGRTPLHLAAMNGHDGVVRLLLETGASSDATLRQVAAKGHDRAQRLLMMLAEADGGINKEDSKGDVPLSLAATNSHKAVVKLLLANGADIVSCGDAVLRIAIRTKDISLVEVLIQKGVDVNATDSNGQTILQLALLKGTGDIVRLLRDHGAHTTWDQHHDGRREVPWVDAWKYSSNPSAGWE